MSTSVHDLKTLVLSFHPAVAIETVEEERVEGLLREVAADLSMPLYEWTLTQGLTQAGDDLLHRTTAEPRALLQHLQGLTLEAVFHLKDFARHLEEPAVVRQLRDVLRAYTRTRSTLVITGARLRFPPDVDSEVVHYDLCLPGPEELLAVVSAVVGSLCRDRRPPPRSALDQVVRALCGLTLNQARQVVARVLIDDGALRPDDLPRILDHKARLLGGDGLLEIYPAADNRFELGGFGRLKQWLGRARVGWSAEAKELNLSPPKGILLAGVQGCGKSLAAKCIARQWRLPLLKLDAGRLYDKYVGESEKNLRRAIAVAESMAPSLLWIDEIEKAFGAAREGAGDGGVSQRIFATLLSWLQEKRAEVFVVATANDVFGLPPELLRKGRFDELFFVDLPDLQEREAIFRIHLRNRRQDPEAFERMALVEASAGMSGAEIEQAVIGALYRALHEGRPLTTELVLDEIRQTVPLSVTRSEDIERLRTLARERFVPVR
ncbi:MAG: AAA family ATPase [Myxococcota bacterium]